MIRFHVAPFLFLILLASSAMADTLECWNVQHRTDYSPMFTAKIIADNRIGDIRFSDTSTLLPDVPGELAAKPITNKKDPYVGYNLYSGQFWLTLPARLSIDALARASRTGNIYGTNQNGMLIYQNGKNYQYVLLICYTDAYPADFNYWLQFL